MYLWVARLLRVTQGFLCFEAVDVASEFGVVVKSIRKGGELESRQGSKLIGC